MKPGKPADRRLNMGDVVQWTGHGPDNGIRGVVTKRRLFSIDIAWEDGMLDTYAGHKTKFITKLPTYKITVEVPLDKPERLIEAIKKALGEES